METVPLDPNKLGKGRRRRDDRSRKGRFPQHRIRTKGVRSVVICSKVTMAQIMVAKVLALTMFRAPTRGKLFKFPTHHGITRLVLGIRFARVEEEVAMVTQDWRTQVKKLLCPRTSGMKGIPTPRQQSPFGS